MEITVGQTVVLQGVENAGIDLTGKRGTVTAELPGGLVSVALAGGADVISVWPEHLKVVPSEPSDYFRATKLLGQPAITSRFYVGITRTTEVVGVDWNMFEDMRPSERTDAREELESTAKRYDIDGGTISDALEDEELPDWVLEGFKTKSGAWRRQLLDLFATREEANRAAKDIVEPRLPHRCRGLASFTSRRVTGQSRSITSARSLPKRSRSPAATADLTHSRCRRRIRWRASPRPMTPDSRRTRRTSSSTAIPSEPTSTTWCARRCVAM